MHLLSRIQEKDSATKTRYSFAFAGVVTGIIALIWVSALPSRVTERMKLAQQEKTETTVDKESIGSIFGDVKSQLGNIASWDDIKEATEETDTSETVDATDTNETATETYTGSALDTVNMHTASPTPSGVVNSASSSLPMHISPEGGETGEVVDTAPQTPRVILIGTTTSQKTE